MPLQLRNRIEERLKNALRKGNQWLALEWSSSEYGFPGVDFTPCFPSIDLNKVLTYTLTDNDSNTIVDNTRLPTAMQYSTAIILNQTILARFHIIEDSRVM